MTSPVPRSGAPKSPQTEPGREASTPEPICLANASEGTRSGSHWTGARPAQKWNSRTSERSLSVELPGRNKDKLLRGDNSARRAALESGPSESFGLNIGEVLSYYFC
ncbi:hypothetical protein DPEC_G00214370 [Dallia pectoralis]|uniref:Uncharacterized protein n=1 Tax=Dallia pectoralis TaxID=75939 RepID=A0ACC2G2C9_DALPE|nr:hypothetical protein DPEC_G00214370 [Dallia pectoralis]